MNKTYILIDTYNLFFRALYTSNDSDIEMCKGLSLHTMFSMIKKACDMFKPDCLIACRDGNKSWRKEFYQPYKENRKEKYNQMSISEIEKHNALKDVFENEFLPFIDEKTNIPLLSFHMAEADDLIARFIKLHPNDIIIILSTDNDFVQLLNDNVFIYNSMDERIISNKCIINAVDKKPISFILKEGKVSVPKEQPSMVTQLIPSDDWVEYSLFMKCIRGDKSDNIMSAYPGVREKSTKNKIGIRDAFLNKGGIDYDMFMNQTWVDPVGETHVVKDDYNRNKKIIDLNCIPDELGKNIDAYIIDKLNQPIKTCIGISLLKFFQKWRLVNLENTINSFGNYFQKGYNAND